MSVHSAGILLYRITENTLQVMLVHPGGPFWVKKDEMAWSIPKGIYQNDEDPFTAAKREFSEETGYEVSGKFLDLGEIKQPSGKIVHIWALQHDLDTSRIVSNHFSLEWPPNSGNLQQFPEVDKGQWFEVHEAMKKISKGQRAFLERLMEKLHNPKDEASALHGGE